MTERLIVYSCHADAMRHSTTMGHLRDFAAEVRAIDGRGVQVEVIDGNIVFPETRTLLHKTMLISRQDDGSCPFDRVCHWAGTAMTPPSGLRPTAREAGLGSPGLEAAKIWERPAPDEIPTSLSGKIVVISDSNISSIKQTPEAHGVVWEPFAFLVRDYRNILWHEAAHLFGAKDHYCRDDRNKAIPECKSPYLCIMQWDPAEKPCAFCEKSKAEIRGYLGRH